MTLKRVVHVQRGVLLQGTEPVSCDSLPGHVRVVTQFQNWLLIIVDIKSSTSQPGELRPPLVLQPASALHHFVKMSSTYDLPTESNRVINDHIS